MESLSSSIYALHPIIKGEDVKDGPMAEDTKVTYKSFKKKYRKMRSKFDHAMRESNSLFKEEQRALENAKRLAQENDQLLDLLLDANSSAQIPAFHRIDLDVPSVYAVPGLISDYAEQASQLTFEGESGKLLQTEIQKLLKEREMVMKPPGSGKSLTHMMSTIPHKPLDIIPGELSADLQENESGPLPVSYLHPDQVDDYLWWIDGSLGMPGYPTLAPAVHGQSHSAMKERELSVGNPNSVYNWLRQHEPKIFLQDGEGSEKSSGKPGALRGAGKRASIPAPSKPDQVEFVEEDGIGYEISLGGVPYPKNMKRKRDEDGGYRPKGGSSRPTKRKKASTGGEPSKGKSKSKATETSPSPPS